MLNTDISKAIIRSQHCQRNWDLSKSIPEADIELFKTAVTQCPSKQNVRFFNVKFITNRDVIEKIHAETNGFSARIDKEGPCIPENTTNHTNSQTLANLLVVMEYAPISEKHKARFESFDNKWKRDTENAVGIAAGYLNVVASLKGYRTGCCACLNNKGVKDILGTENDIALMMGIGFRDETRNRREHHSEDGFVFPTFQKEEIEYERIA